MRMFRQRKAKPPPISIPTKEWHDAAIGDTQFTPDHINLAKKDWNLVFLYGQHMKPQDLHEDIGECKFKKPYQAFTADKFSLWKAQEDNMAILLDVGYKGHPDAPKTMVKGELFAIRFCGIKNLDYYHSNGYTFNRERRTVIVPHRGRRDSAEVTLEHVLAWMYVGVVSHWEPRLDAGFNFAPVRRFHRRNDPDNLNYYCYTRMELNE